jgi:hypothetical protein
MAEVRLFRWCEVESGARVKTGDLGAPVDLNRASIESCGGSDIPSVFCGKRRNEDKRLRSARGRDSEYSIAPLGGERRRGEEKRSRNALKLG